jgi:hypothetical protein
MHSSSAAAPPRHHTLRAHFALEHLIIKHSLHSVRYEQRDFAATRRAAQKGVV